VCNSIVKLPKSMVDLRSLQYLNLISRPSYWIWGKPSRDAFAAADICKLTTLTTLHISGRPCKPLVCDQLSELVLKLVKLNKFQIKSFDKLETLPDAIQSMVHLEVFRVGHCKRIKVLPQFITLFSKLKVLRLEFMDSLESLPALNTLELLSTLSIFGCKSMKEFPVSFTSSNAFPNLKELDCLASGLVKFSEVEDGAMRKLEILNLDGTNIKSLPDTLINLKNLKVVYIPKDRFNHLCKNFENTWLLSKFSLRDR
jgi:Leucine-rich repeat (LRR) protein